MKTLHILNGDSTLNGFKETSIAGDVLVWREILSEGPVAQKNLWPLRSEWMRRSFGENSASYHHNVIDEVAKLDHLRNYNSLILWFEYDLVCQINLIYILSVLSKHEPRHYTIELICPDSFPNKPNFRGLGELNAAELTQLYPTKIKLTTADLILAARAWELYIENDPKKIELFLTIDFGNLSLLKNALKANLLRFPKSENELNYIEETLLKLINSGITNRFTLYEAFWAKESIFGMTDLQINLVLFSLKEKGLIAPKTSSKLFT